MAESARLKELKAKQAEERSKLKAEEKIRRSLPEAYREQASIFVHNLYGTCASVKWEAPYAGPALNVEHAAKIVEAIGAVSVTLVKDGCTSFRPTSYVEALPEEKKERWKEESAVSPLRFHIESVTRTVLEFQWFAMVGGLLVSCKIVCGMPWSTNFGSYTYKRQDYPGGYRIVDTKFAPGSQMHTIMRDGEPIAQLESPIKWWSSEEYPNPITLYFVDLGEDMDPSMVATSIAKHVAACVGALP